LIQALTPTGAFQTKRGRQVGDSRKSKPMGSKWVSRTDSDQKPRAGTQRCQPPKARMRIGAAKAGGWGTGHLGCRQLAGGFFLGARQNRKNPDYMGDRRQTVLDKIEELAGRSLCKCVDNIAGCYASMTPLTRSFRQSESSTSHKASTLNRSHPMTLSTECQWEGLVRNAINLFSIGSTEARASLSLSDLNSRSRPVHLPDH
jgi:hypothetical protein